MKKLLLSTAAVAGLAMVATPAAAQVTLDLGGYFKGYGAYVDQDEATGLETNDFDIIRNTEVHFGGETTVDNGLTIGAHFEVEADGGDSFAVDESYAYFSGAWGRVNFGAEDGAQYLLQVAAPSADSNIDGIRQFVNPVNYTVLLTGGTQAGQIASFNPGAKNSGGVDYDADASGKTDKFTYLTPIMNGFQGGISYSPDTDNAVEAGIGTDDVDDTIGVTYEIALRYEGQFQNVGVIAGAGYSHGEEEDDTNGTGTTDDREQWNIGLDLDFGAFGLGAAYVEDNGAVDSSATTEEEETLVIGADYTHGAFKFGVSYYDQDNTFTVRDLETKRYSGGVTYTYGPGMTLRGSIGHVEHDATGIDGGTGNEVDATYFTLGTQVNF